MTNSSSHTNGSTSDSLLDRIRSGDADSWTRLTELYGPLVHYWCRRFGLNNEDTVDVVQETFFSVAKSIENFQKRSSGGFRAWLWTITRNKIRDFGRRKAQRPNPDGGSAAYQRLMEIPDQAPDDSFEGQERNATVSLLHRGMNLVRNEFEDRTWQAFWQVVVEGHSTADVAADLGISANGIRQAKSRVLRRLREELGDFEELA